MRRIAGMRCSEVPRAGRVSAAMMALSSESARATKLASSALGTGMEEEDFHSGASTNSNEDSISVGGERADGHAEVVEAQWRVVFAGRGHSAVMISFREVVHRKPMETIQSGGRTIRIHVSEPDGEGEFPAVLLLHGAGGNVYFWLDHIAPAIAQLGIAVYAVHYFDSTGTAYATPAIIGDTVSVPAWLAGGKGYAGVDGGTRGGRSAAYRAGGSVAGGFHFAGAGDGRGSGRGEDQDDRGCFWRPGAGRGMGWRRRRFRLR